MPIFTRGTKMFYRSGRLEQIAEAAMKEFDDLAYLDDPECRIAYQFCDLEKKNHNQLVFADCETIKEKYKEFMPYDYIITFYEPNCAALDDERLKRVMYHELKHVGWEGDGKYRITPHNVEDFRECIEKWGLDWVKPDKDTTEAP